MVSLDVSFVSFLSITLTATAVPVTAKEPAVSNEKTPSVSLKTLKWGKLQSYISRRELKEKEKDILGD